MLLIYIYIHVCTILEIKTIMSMSLRGQPLEHIFEDESTVHLHGLEFRWWPGYKRYKPPCNLFLVRCFFLIPDHRKKKRQLSIHRTWTQWLRLSRAESMLWQLDHSVNIFAASRKQKPLRFQNVSDHQMKIQKAFFAKNKMMSNPPKFCTSLFTHWPKDSWG